VVTYDGIGDLRDGMCDIWRGGRMVIGKGRRLMDRGLAYAYQAEEHGSFLSVTELGFCPVGASVKEMIRRAKLHGDVWSFITNAGLQWDVYHGWRRIGEQRWKKK
jgi:hypothetical protein